MIYAKHPSRLSLFVFGRRPLRRHRRRFLPGFLLLLGVLKNWQVIASKPLVAGALTGVNAAVVGLLLAALYQPIFTSAVSSGLNFALIIVGVWLLKTVKMPVVGLVGVFIAAGVVLNYL